MEIRQATRQEKVKPEIPLNKLKLTPFLRDAGRYAAQMNIRAWLVGGAVRDFMMGKKHLDWDVTVQGNTPALVKILAKKYRGHVRSHPRFGTFVIELAGGKHIDFATARRETYPRPGVLPVVTFTNLRDDLYRRDFTINALAISLDGNHPCEIVDYYGGGRDLAKKTLRILHPKSFRDDPTRIFRLARFAARGFRIEKNTLKFAVAGRRYLPLISAERKREELLAILAEPRPSAALELIAQWKMWSDMLPGAPHIADPKTIDGKKSVAERILALVPGLDHTQRKKVFDAIKLPRAIRRDIYDRLLAMEKKPPLSGNDLIRMGYAPGPVFKTILNALKREGITSRRKAEEFVFDKFSRKR